MKLIVGCTPIVTRSFGVRRITLGRATDSMPCRHHARLPGDIAELNCSTQAQKFYLDPGLRQVDEVLLRYRRHPEAALRRRRDKSLGCESRQRLADRARTHVKLLTEVVDLHAQTPGPPARQDFTPTPLASGPAHTS